MPEPQWAGRNPSQHDGGGGGGGGDGSFAAPVEIAPTDPNDPAPLLEVVAPADYENVSSDGRMVSTRDSLGHVIFVTDVWGSIRVTAPPGMGPGTLELYGADNAADKGVTLNSNTGIIIKGTGAMLSVESDNRASFVFRCTPDPDVPTLAFFGASSAPQQEAPTTLEDVIAVLTAYGLVKAAG